MDQLESNYDCSNASVDLHSLMEELSLLKADSGTISQESREQINRIENQIRFIANKCDIPSAIQ